MDESPQQDATWHVAHGTRPKGRRRPRIRGPPLCCAAAPHPPHTWQISHSPGLSFPTCTVGTSSASQICRQSLCPGLGATDSGRSAREASHGWARGQDCPVPCGSPRHADQPWAVGPHASPPHSGHLVKGPPPVPPPWATLPGLLGASCLLAQARGPSLGRLVTAPGPSFPPSCVCPLCALQMGIAACLLCQHQLEPGDRDGRGREAPAASRPGARGSCPSMGVWSGLASGQLPTYDPAAHPRDCQANARQGSGTSKDSPRQGGGLGKGQHSLRWHGFRNFLAEAAVKPLKAKFLAPPTPRAKSL